MPASTSQPAAPGVAWLTFDNPARRNAMTLDMWVQADECLQAHAADPDTRVVIMRGAGDEAFVSGADITEFQQHRQNAEAAARYAEAPGKCRARMSGFEKPLLAMLHGYCFGAGVDIALRADVRWASSDAVISIPAARLGLAYGFDSIRLLTHLIGPSAAKELLFSGRRLNAQEALDLGLVNFVAPAAELEARTLDYARLLAGNAPLTQRCAKFSVDQALTDPDQRDMARVARLIDDCFDSADYAEGRLAFKEKRAPQFRGR